MQGTQTMGIASLFEALFGPLFGYYAMIIFASLAGALWPLSNRPSGDPGNSALFVLRLVLTATALTAGVAVYIESQWGFRSSLATAPIAFCIGAIGDNWLTLINRVVQRVSAFADKFTGNKNEPPPSN
jgi:hypothetical protein